MLRSGAGCAVSITGIAGPGGGSPDKPVGLVWLASATPGARPRTVRHVFAGTREQVRSQATAVALALLADCAA
jgi:nicotinamide-nucleotide amidase